MFSHKQYDGISSEENYLVKKKYILSYIEFLKLSQITLELEENNNFSLASISKLDYICEQLTIKHDQCGVRKRKRMFDQICENVLGKDKNT